VGFASLNNEKNIRSGRKLLNSQLASLGKPLLDQKYTILKNIFEKPLTLSQREGLVEEIGNGSKFVSDIIRRVYPYEEAVIDKVVEPQGSSKEDLDDFDKNLVAEDQILVGGESGLPLKLAACCSPKFGNDIVGYVTRGNRITIHKSSCILLDSLCQERIIYASFKGLGYDAKKYLVGIKFLAFSRVGLMRDLSSAISENEVRIRDLAVKDIDKGLCEGYFLLELRSIDQFDVVLDKLEGISGVLSVSRDDKFKGSVDDFPSD
jgi:GTP pyrophosphokinase